jgi:TM2 domain-containing membrane protein YozV
VHKFYLGMNRPGALMLGLNVGVWVLAILLGIITLAVGFIVTLPLASLVSFVLGVLGLVEGIIYLTKSDEAFARDYLVGKKAWL